MLNAFPWRSNSTIRGSREMWRETNVFDLEMHSIKINKIQFMVLCQRLTRAHTKRTHRSVRNVLENVSQKRYLFSWMTLWFYDELFLLFGSHAGTKVSSSTSLTFRLFFLSLPTSIKHWLDYLLFFFLLFFIAFSFSYWAIISDRFFRIFILLFLCSLINWRPSDQLLISIW